MGQARPDELRVTDAQGALQRPLYTHAAEEDQEAEIVEDQSFHLGQLQGILRWADPLVKKSLQALLEEDG